jgi:hypothetical protein
MSITIGIAYLIADAESAILLNYYQHSVDRDSDLLFFK